jgi:hypothetical protein
VIAILVKNYIIKKEPLDRGSFRINSIINSND